ncbi:MAG: hypothetical protein ACI8YQ_002022 [Polaribacter sp.]|jgi:hypothetical protein
MTNTKMINQLLTAILMMSSTIWAVVIIACGYAEYRNINNILLTGALMEFLLLSSIIRSKNTQRTGGRIKAKT